MAVSKELQAFLAFCEAAFVTAEDISEPTPPAPDILALVRGQLVAYEVTEAVEPAFAQRLEALVKSTQLIREAYASLAPDVAQAIESRHGGKVIGICFRDGVSLNRRRQLMPAVFEVVRGIEVAIGEDDHEWIENPLPQLHHISMRQIRRNGIHWESDPTAGWIDPEAALRARLIDKMINKSYETEHPIELVVYFWREVTPPPATGWVEAMGEVAGDLLGASPFRRVWLYDDWTKSATVLAGAALS